MKAILNLHMGDELRAIGSSIHSPSGATATVRVVHYNQSNGSLKVFLHVSDDEPWEESWSLSRADGPERATFMRDQTGNFDTVQVAVKKP